MTASIEYAVAVLGVRHIIVCGHTDCGATGALDIPALKGLPHVKECCALSLCQGDRAERHGIEGDAPVDAEFLNEAIEENVLQQVQHLRTHPVAAKLSTGKIEIHGWVYDIKSGNIRCCGRDSIEFRDFDDYYSDIIARVSGD